MVATTFCLTIYMRQQLQLWMGFHTCNSVSSSCLFLPSSCFTVAASLCHAETVDCTEFGGAYFFSIMAYVLSSAFYQNYTRFTLHRTCFHLQVLFSKNWVIFQKGGSFKVWIFFFLSGIHVLTSKNTLKIYFIKFTCVKNLFTFNLVNLIKKHTCQNEF